MVGKWSAVTVGLVLCIVLSHGVAADDKKAQPQQVTISLLVLETDKADLQMLNLLLDVANSTQVQKTNDERFIHRLETSSLNRIVNGLVKLKKAKVLASPDLIVTSGRTGSFLSGGNFQVPNTSGEGGAQGSSTSLRAFGTSLSMAPKIEGNAIMLGLTCEFSELLPEQAVNGVPGLRTRMARFETLLNSNQTVVVGGEFATNPLPEKREDNSLLDRIPNVSKLFTSGQPANNSRLVVCVSAKPVEPLKLLKQEVVQAPNLLDSTGSYPIANRQIVWPAQDRATGTNRLIEIPRVAPQRFVTPAGFVPALDVQRAPTPLPIDGKQQARASQHATERSQDLFNEPLVVKPIQFNPGSILDQLKSVQPIPNGSRLQNMRSALVHLQAAGLEEQAADVKREIQVLVRAQTAATLKQKNEELRQLQSEIQLLRQAIGDEK